MEDASTNISTAVEIPWWVQEVREDVESEVLWITGGLGSGKTYGSVIWFVERMLLNDASRLCWAIAQTHSKVKDILLPTFADVLENYYHLTEGSDYKITITAPAEIKIRGVKNVCKLHSATRPDLMTGTNISHYLMTEAAFQKREVFERCQTRCRCPRAAVRQGMLDLCPEGLNWCAELGNFEGYDPKQKARRYQLYTEDNKYLPADYIDKLTRTYAYDPMRLRSYLYGEFVPFTKGSAYWEFFHSRNVKLDLVLEPTQPIMLCWDFNKSPLAWVVMQKQLWRRGSSNYHRFAAVQESDGQARGLLDACAEFIAKVPPRQFENTPIEVYGDPSGYAGSHLVDGCSYDIIERALKKYYKNVHICAARSAPLVKDRLERHNALMAYELFVVAAWCRNLIKSLSVTELNKGEWRMKKPPDDDWSHWGDAVGYPLFQLTRKEDLEDPDKPKVYGASIN